MINMEEFKLDEKDKKIILELQINSRASFSYIGKRVKLPKSVVAYRVKRMVDSGFIPLFCTVFDKSKLGYIRARLFLKLHNFNKNIENRMISFLKKQKGMFFIASLNGCYDFHISFVVKDMNELNKVYSEIIYKFNKYLLEKELSIPLKTYYSSFHYVFGEEGQKDPHKRAVSKKFKITQTDIDIIDIINQNSRTSILDISEKLKITPKTANSRIKELIKNKIIQKFKIRINHSMLGYHHFHTFINLSNINQDEENKLVEFINSFKSTIKVLKGTGKYDLEFESILKSHFELYEILTKIKNKFREKIQNTDIALICKIYEINTLKYEKH